MLCAAVTLVTCAVLASAESVLESELTLVRFLESERLLGKTMDLISDLTTRIRNAVAVGSRTVKVLDSKAVAEVAKTLKSGDYLLSIEKNPEERALILSFNEAQPISHIRRLSKPGLRQYAGYAKLPKTKSGSGFVVVSTPKGIMSGHQAKKQKVGGEVMLEIW